MTKTFIKEGWGFSAGNNFARASADLEFAMTAKRAGKAYGTITPMPDSPLGFLRGPHRISVTVDTLCLTEKDA